MSTGKGIAIAGIWIGVGMSAFGAGMFAVFIAVIAMAATEIISKY